MYTGIEQLGEWMEESRSHCQSGSVTNKQEEEVVMRIYLVMT